jgi:hypothetical protein
MKSIDQRLLTEIGDLVSLGASHNELIAVRGNGLNHQELAKVTMWVTRVGRIIRELYGERSQHYATYKSAADTPDFFRLHKSHSAHFSQMYGVVCALKHDADSGLLADFRSLVQAEVFSSFLEMGEYLLQGSYKDAAAVIIGSVLEDALRQLSVANGIPIASPDGKLLTIDPLNSQLAKAGVYSKLVQKQVTTWAHVRNKAAHGQYAEYTKDQVQMMLLFVQSFCSEHL